MKGKAHTQGFGGWASKAIAVALSLASADLTAQNVGIGPTSFTPSEDALLELRSLSSGMLIPRMGRDHRDAIPNPTESLLIYQLDHTPGFYYYDGTEWVPLVRADMVVESIDNLGNHVAEQNIVLGGNSIVNVDGGPGIALSDAGYLGAGTDQPLTPIHVLGGPVPTFQGQNNGILTVQSEYIQDFYAPIDFMPSISDQPMARIAARMTPAGASMSLGTSSGYGSGITNTAMTISTAGNVGIGSVAPKERLEVEDGHIVVSNSTGTASSIKMQGTGSGHTNFRAGAQGATEIDYTMPLAQGAVNTVIRNDGAGNLSWMPFTSLLGTVTRAVNGDGNAQARSVDTYADLNQMTLPVTVGTYIVLFNAQFTMSTGNTVGEFAVSVGGVIDESIRQVMAPSNNAPGNVSIMSVIEVAGDNDAKILFRRVTGGTCTVTGRTMILVKIV